MSDRAKFWLGVVLLAPGQIMFLTGVLGSVGGSGWRLLVSVGVALVGMLLMVVGFSFMYDLLAGGSE